MEPVKNICPQQHKHRQLFLLADCSVAGQMLFLQPSFCISKWDESPSMKFIEHFRLEVKGCKCMELLRKKNKNKKSICLCFLDKHGAKRMELLSPPQNQSCLTSRKSIKWDKTTANRSILRQRDCSVFDKLKKWNNCLP